MEAIGAGDSGNQATPPRRPALPLALVSLSAALMAAPYGVIPLVPFLLAISGLGLWYWPRRGQSWRRSLPSLLLLLAIAIGVYFYAQQTPIEDTPIALAYPDGAKAVEVAGHVVEGTPSVGPRHDDSPPESDIPALFRSSNRSSRTYLLQVATIDGKPTSGRVKVYVRFGERVYAGQKVIAKGNLSPIRAPTNPGSYDARRAAQREGYSARLYTNKPADSRVIGHDFALRGLAEHYRSSIWMNVGRDMQIGNDALLSAIALGERSTLPPIDRENFVRTGTVHLLVVSGLHVLVMVSLVAWILRPLGIADYRVREALRILIALLFLFVSGAHIATLRAVIMVIFFSIARLRGRGHDMLNTLASAAFFVVLIDPGDVASEGFALSFITVAAFLVFLPALSYWRRDSSDEAELEKSAWTTSNFAKQSLLSTGIAGAVTMPIVVTKWNLITPISLIVNLVCVFPIFLILSASLFLPLSGIDPIASALAWLLDLLVGILRAIVGYASEVKGGVIFLATPSILWPLIIYAALTLLAFFFIRAGDRREGVSKRVVLCTLGVLTLFALHPLTIKGNPNETVFTQLDMRQGSAAYLHAANGDVALFDCGAQSRPQAGARVVGSALLQDGITHIDYLFLSHDDTPSANGVAELLSRVSVGTVGVSKDFTRNPEGLEALLWLEDRVERVLFLDAGDAIPFGDGQIRVHWPRYEDLDDLTIRKDRSDTSSLVLSFENESSSLLFTGGIDKFAIRAIAPSIKDTDILIAPRHGGVLKILPTLLESVKPHTTLISAREGFVKARTRQDYRSHSQLVLESADLGALRKQLVADSEWMCFQDGAWQVMD